MTQLSGFWTTGGSIGHQQTSYTQAQLGTAGKIFAGGSGYQGVVPGLLNELAGSVPTSNTVRINTGGAMADGRWYLNDSSVNVNIPSAVGSGNTRIDRIVIRCDWANYKAEIYRIAGVDASNPSPPVISQSSGSLYDIMLYQALVNTVGFVQITDERVWARRELADGEVTSTKIADGAVTEAKLASGAVTEAKLGSGAVTATKIAVASINGTKIVDEGIYVQNLATGAVTNPKIADGAVTESKLSGIKTIVYLQVLTPEEALEVGDGAMYFTVPSDLNGAILTDADGVVYTASSSGLPTVQLRRIRSGAGYDMLSTRITIDANELTSYTAVTQPVIDTAYDDVLTGDQIRVDVDVAGTGTKGLDVILVFTK